MTQWNSRSKWGTRDLKIDAGVSRLFPLSRGEPQKGSIPSVFWEAACEALSEEGCWWPVWRLLYPNRRVKT